MVSANSGTSLLYQLLLPTLCPGVLRALFLVKRAEGVEVCWTLVPSPTLEPVNPPESTQGSLGLQSSLFSRCTLWLRVPKFLLGIHGLLPWVPLCNVGPRLSPPQPPPDSLGKEACVWQRGLEEGGTVGRAQPSGSRDVSSPGISQIPLSIEQRSRQRHRHPTPTQPPAAVLHPPPPCFLANRPSRVTVLVPLSCPFLKKLQPGPCPLGHPTPVWS